MFFQDSLNFFSYLCVILFIMKNTKVNKTVKNNPGKKDGELSAAQKADIDKFVKDLLKRRGPLFKKLAHA